MARHQRARWLRVRHARRHPDPSLSRAARCRVAGAAWPSRARVATRRANTAAGGQIGWLSRLDNPSRTSSLTSGWSVVCRSGPTTLDGTTIEKRLVMPRLQNTVLVTYTVLEPGSRFVWGFVRTCTRGRTRRPSTTRSRHRLSSWRAPGISRRRSTRRSRRSCSRSATTNRRSRLHPEVTKDVPYLLERQRGYASVGDTWSPGYFKLDLAEGERATFIASTESAVGP